MTSRQSLWIALVGLVIGIVSLVPAYAIPMTPDGTPGGARNSMILAVGLSIAADAPKENAAKKEMEKLQGTWQLVEGETFFQGRAFKAPKEEVEMEKVIIKGDNWTYRPAKGPDGKARFQLGATKESKTIDLVWTDGDNKGKTYPGVFTLDGDTLKICYAREGKVRPSGFTAEATKEIKDHCVLMVLKREKP